MEFISIGKHNIDLYLEDLKAFNENIFIKAFPDDDEREDFQNQIIPRIRQEVDKEPYSYCTLVKDSDSVCGGLVADWYPGCKSLELIYIAVDSSKRRGGIGRELLQKGFEQMRGLIEADGHKLDYVFLEVDIPFETRVGMDPVSRLRFWDRMGAMRIPCKYTQPPLSAGKEPASNLMLLTMPVFNSGEDKECINTADLKSFLEYFYTGLDAEESPFLKQMYSQLDMLDDEGYIALESLSERPTAFFEDVVISYHFTFDDDTVTLPDTCSQFNSFECDLMNYSNQELRPFRTCHLLLEKNLELKMPDFYCYTSEGNTHYFLTDPGKTGALKADVSINVSRPRMGSLSVAHLCITPSAGSRFSDLDVIRLITKFGSRQENYTATSEPKFLVDGKELDSREILQYRIGGRLYKQIHEGVSQFSISGISAAPGRKFKRTDFSKARFFSRFRNEEHSELKDSVLNKLVCGLILGIFDYHRMAVEEIIDTVRPIVQKDDSFMVLCRGHLIKFHNPDKDEKRMLSKILISPYILIPSTALAINDITLDKCEALMNTAFKHKYKIEAQYGESAELRLNEDYLEDIFEYESEKEIVRKGREERSMNKRYRSLLEKIEIYKNRKELSSNLVVEAVLGIVAIFQIMEVVTGKVSVTWEFITILILFSLMEIFRWYKIRKG